uniref:Methyltransferase type 11 domain-containing protein n=1 Tax=Pipistrellus kuhlii TaxID=59472 RepID=A0A7J7ZJJ5_PIPKU|nr:hypothetical protein mPipKuh1_009441 [Pipistrellus kuhlii]
MLPLLPGEVHLGVQQADGQHEARALRQPAGARQPLGGALCLLELGCGTGANFQFYPPGCRVTCVDPNPNFEKFLIQSIAENRHVQFERFVVAAGEDMRLVADGSVDTVLRAESRVHPAGGQGDLGHATALVASSPSQSPVF